MVSESERPWAAIGARRPPSCTAACSCAKGSRTRRQRHPLRLDRPGGHGPAGGAARGRPRWSSRSSARTTRGRWSRRSRLLRPGGQPDADRVAAAAPGPRPLHVLLRPRGRADATESSPTRSARSTRRRSRCGSSAPIRGGQPTSRACAHPCVEFGSNMARVLVLNATYEPINVCTLRRAAVLLLKEKAELLERREGARSTPST